MPARSIEREPLVRWLQDVSGGKPVPVQGTDLPLWGLEIDPEEAKSEFMAYSATNNVGAQVRHMAAPVRSLFLWGHSAPC